uniref:Uncharacterized protein n=1 Tax=Peronospora matthiolae TaxID=2874970 RepID=A0AAV1TRZ8_9STRA
MRCASKAAESASARLCADAEAETTATDVSLVAEATQPVHLVMQALVTKTLMSSQSMSSVSHTLPILKMDLYQRRSKPSRLPSVAWMMLRVVASLVHQKNQMNHRRSEGARGRETRALTVVSFLLLTPLRSEVPVLLSARRKKSGTATCCVSLREEDMDASKIRHGSLVGDDE